MSKIILIKEEFIIEQKKENIIVEAGDRIQVVSEESYKYICMPCGYKSSSMPDNYVCPVCGAAMQPMLESKNLREVITVRVEFDNGDSLITKINTDLQGAKDYYLGNTFNLGSGGQDVMTKAIKVTLIESINRKREAVDIKKVIKDLQGNFAGSNEEQMKSVQLLKGLATSDDPLSNKFMKALDKETTRISKEILIKENNMIKILKEGSAEIVNPEDKDFWDNEYRFYTVYNDEFVVYADNLQEAVNYLADYVVEKGYHGYIGTQEDYDEYGDEGYIIAGNTGIYLDTNIMARVKENGRFIN